MIEDEKKEIVDLLKSKKIRNKCISCDGMRFTLIDGYFRPFMYNDMNTKRNEVTINIPQVCVVCNNCGFIMSYSLGILKMKDLPDISIDV